MHEMHATIFTTSRKRASGFTPGVFQGVYFELFISFVHYLGITIKEKCSPFKQGIIQKPIMSINKVLTHLAYIANGKKTCYIVQQFHWANKRDVTLRHL